jgi:hypothetical protein
MKNYKNIPMFDMAELNEGGGSANERFDFDKVSAYRQTIAEHTKTALATLASGTTTVNTNFGTKGEAMRGGSSNYVNSKWNSLTKVFANFSKYIDGTLENVRIASKSNESFEDKVQELFKELGLEEFDNGESGELAPVSGTATNTYYTEM